MDSTLSDFDGKYRILPAANLETWSIRNWTDGIQVDQLDDLDRVVAQTTNSTYEITVICAGARDVLVRGGKYFPERTPTHILGASYGGSILKVSGIYTGFNIEFLYNGRRIVTTPVRLITRVRRDGSCLQMLRTTQQWAGNNLEVFNTSMNE